MFSAQLLTNAVRSRRAERPQERHRVVRYDGELGQQVAVSRHQRGDGLVVRRRAAPGEHRGDGLGQEARPSLIRGPHDPATSANAVADTPAPRPAARRCRTMVHARTVSKTSSSTASYRHGPHPEQTGAGRTVGGPPVRRPLRGTMKPVTTSTTRRIAYQGPAPTPHQVCKGTTPTGRLPQCVVRGRLRSGRVRGRGPGDDPDRQPRSPAGWPTSTTSRPAPGLHIVAEHFLRIRFCLMGVPGTTLGTIRTVHSHVHALGQCRKIIREHGFTPVISGDTAARPEVKVRRPHPGRDLAPLAADIYGLEILAGTSGTRSTTPRASSCSPASSSRRHPATARWSPASSSTLRNLPARALPGPGRLRDQRREHDQARELHGRRRVHRHPVPRRGRRAPDDAG